MLYTYDAFDRRVAKQVDDTGDLVFDRHERYVWDGDEVALVLNGTTGNVEHRFLHGPAIDQVFADEFASGGNSILHWYLGDNQNTTRDVVDSNGAVLNHLAYSVFGKIAGETDASKTPFFAYTGREWDEDTNLQYNRRRWYDPELGRWISEDPIRFAAGDTNLYRYVGNGPTNSIDPSGLVDSMGPNVTNWHHLFPQGAKFAEFLDSHGLSDFLNSPENGWWLLGEDHRQLNGCWNQDWERWMESVKGQPVSR